MLKKQSNKKLLAPCVLKPISVFSCAQLKKVYGQRHMETVDLNKIIKLNQLVK